MTGVIDYGAAPDIGTELEWSEQTYRVVGSRNFAVRGKHVGWIRWATVCPDCAAEHHFETGLKKRYFPKRCRACNGPDDLDAIERKAFASKAWGERLAAGRAKKKAGAKVVRLLDAELTRHGFLECTAVFDTGGKVALRWAPGLQLDEESSSIQAAIPMLAAEHDRLCTERLLG